MAVLVKKGLCSFASCGRFDCTPRRPKPRSRIEERLSCAWPLLQVSYLSLMAETRRPKIKNVSFLISTILRTAIAPF